MAIDYDAYQEAQYGPDLDGEAEPRPLADVLAEHMDKVRRQRAEDARLEAEYRAEMDRDYWS